MMWTLFCILLVHYIISILILVHKYLKGSRLEYIDIIVAFLIPMFGLILTYYKWKSNINEDDEGKRPDVMRASFENIKGTASMRTTDSDIDAVKAEEQNREDEFGDKGEYFDVRRSIVMDEDELKEKAVPLEEALVVNDKAARRELIIDVLYSNPGNYVPQLFDAKSNGDTEVVHYAATALTEIQKEFDLKFRDIMLKRAENKDSKQLDKEYRELLESYINSGLPEGEGLENQLRKYSEILGKEILGEVTDKKWNLIQKKAETDLRLKDRGALEGDLRLMMDEWPDKEKTYVFRIQQAVLIRDRKLMDEITKEIDEKNIHLSHELKELIYFWNGENTEDVKEA